MSPSERPIRTIEDVEAFESERPLGERIPSTIYRLFEESARRHGLRTALTMIHTGADDEVPQRISYVDLHARITQAANLFASLGGQGAGVAYMLPTVIDTQVVLWAAETAGYAVPLNPLLSNEQIIDLIRSSEARVLVTCSGDLSSPLFEKAREIQAALPGLQLVCVGQASEASDVRWVDFGRALAQQPSDRLGFALRDEPNGIAAYFHTGGTTGSPKLVAHTHRNQLTAALGSAVLLGLTPDDVITNGMPMFHVGGAIPCSLAPLMSGANLLILSPLGLRNAEMIRRYWRIVEKYGVTLACAVPTAISAILSQPVDGDLGTVRCGVTGAAPMPRSLAEKFVAMTSRPLHEVLGMTETGGATAIDPTAGRATVSSVGLPLPYTRLQVLKRGEDGKPGSPCQPGEIGVLVVSGPTVSPGYRDAAQNKGVFESGSLNSGDLAYVGKDGKLFIAGRAKDLIIRSGHNIDPAMIEGAVTAHPQVALAAAVGQPDAYTGELPVCYVTLAPGATVTPEELGEFARERINERPAWPKQIHILPSLPVTGVGKIFKPALRADAAMRVLVPLLDAALGAGWGKLEVTEGGPRGMRVVARLSRDDQALYAAADGAMRGFLFDYLIVAAC